jgi:quercetin dioxygenase-like cupin family protein
MENPLERLKSLTPELPPINLGDLKGEQVRSNILRYNIDGGTCISYGLFSSPDISVARTFVSAGSLFPEHQHEEREFALIFSGSAMVSVNGEKETYLGPGQCIVLEPNIPHVSRALENTWFIAITIPYSKDYPNAR